MATSAVRENRRQVSKAIYHSTLAAALEGFVRDELPLIRWSFGEISSFVRQRSDERELIPSVLKLSKPLLFWLLTRQKPPIYLENMAILLKNRGYLAITHQYR